MGGATSILIGLALNSMTFAGELSQSSGLGKNYKIDDNEDLNSGVERITKVSFPFFTHDISIITTPLSLASGNKALHQGLVIQLTNGKYYMAQTYRQCLLYCSDESSAVNQIRAFSPGRPLMRLWTTNNRVPNNITLGSIKTIIDDMPDYYHLLRFNCQDFCNQITKKTNAYKI